MELRFVQRDVAVLEQEMTKYSRAHILLIFLVLLAHEKKSICPLGCVGLASKGDGLRGEALGGGGLLAATFNLDLSDGLMRDTNEMPTTQRSVPPQGEGVSEAVSQREATVADTSQNGRCPHD
ncbi:hypothetical protein EYF80_027498 [Liparis tanakae]|uniref:Uncharacterized protein n=1 Tax=Liparis tanakae TaxID=230148 RepID=A0A4Z2HBH3_9TELE|nr:hypothetical protein EYF80_027498 [Liparis tanakae]